MIFFSIAEGGKEEKEERYDTYLYGRRPVAQLGKRGEPGLNFEV